jgi:hypothetical protein
VRVPALGVAGALGVALAPRRWDDPDALADAATGWRMRGRRRRNLARGVRRAAAARGTAVLAERWPAGRGDRDSVRLAGAAPIS